MSSVTKKRIVPTQILPTQIVTVAPDIEPEPDLPSEEKNVALYQLFLKRYPLQLRKELTDREPYTKEDTLDLVLDVAEKTWDHVANVQQEKQKVREQSLETWIATLQQGINEKDLHQAWLNNVLYGLLYELEAGDLQKRSVWKELRETTILFNNDLHVDHVYRPDVSIIKAIAERYRTKIPVDTYEKMMKRIQRVAQTRREAHLLRKRKVKKVKKPWQKKGWKQKFVVKHKPVEQLTKLGYINRFVNDYMVTNNMSRKNARLLLEQEYDKLHQAAHNSPSVGSSPALSPDQYPSPEWDPSA